MRTFKTISLILMATFLASTTAVPAALDYLSDNSYEKCIAESTFSNEGERSDGLDDMFAAMDELNHPDLADLTGQVGIRIDLSVEIYDGYVAWGDSDGVSDDYLSDPAYLTMSDIRLNNGMDPVGPMDIIGLTIDAGTDNKQSYILIGMPSISGLISFDEVKIGKNIDEGESLGSLVIGDFRLAPSHIKITSH